MNYYQKNRDIRLTYQKQYYQDNKQEIIQYTKNCYSKNKEILKQKRKEKYKNKNGKNQKTIDVLQMMVIKKDIILIFSTAPQWVAVFVRRRCTIILFRQKKY